MAMRRTSAEPDKRAAEFQWSGNRCSSALAAPDKTAASDKTPRRSRIAASRQLAAVGSGREG